MASLSAVTAGLIDILSRRYPLGSGGSPHRYVELRGGQLVPMHHYEPDPTTHRHDYYYNTTTNCLYCRVVAINRPDIGVIRATWHQVSS